MIKPPCGGRTRPATPRRGRRPQAQCVQVIDFTGAPYGKSNPCFRRERAPSPSTGFFRLYHKPLISHNLVYNLPSLSTGFHGHILHASYTAHSTAETPWHAQSETARLKGRSARARLDCRDWPYSARKNSNQVCTLAIASHSAAPAHGAATLRQRRQTLPARSARHRRRLQRSERHRDFECAGQKKAREYWPPSPQAGYRVASAMDDYLAHLEAEGRTADAIRDARYRPTLSFCRSWDSQAVGIDRR